MAPVIRLLSPLILIIHLINPSPMQTSGNPFQPNAPKVVLEQQFETYLLDKAPFHLPVNIKEAIVKYVPWVNLILMIILFPVVLGALGLGALFAPASFLGGVGSGFMYIITLIFSMASLILSAMALPGLFKRKRSGWVYTYYADLLQVVLNILSFSIIGLLFNLIFLFVLFQVRSYYK